MFKMHEMHNIAILEAKLYTSFNFVVLKKMYVAGISNMLDSMQNMC